jgi:VIT1/CCC1 family predicted Fe2+/Mn2+ transporter/rubrerythrin
MLTAADQRELLSTLEVNWQMEMGSHATYRALAQKEVDARRRNVMRGLAAAERHHARLWAVEIASLGGIPPTYLGSPNGHADAFLAKPDGIDLALRRLRKQERAEIERYKLQALTLTDEASQTTLREVIADENEHYKSLSRLIRARPPVANLAGAEAKKALAALLAARREKHPEAAGWVNDAIYAAHEGLGSIFGIVSGVAGATLGKGHYVLIAGLAGMVGSAISTGTGAYLTARSERDLYDASLLRERRAVDYDQAEAREVLALSLQVRGLPGDVASRLSHLVADDKEGLVRALARSNGSSTEESLSDPWVSAVAGFGATGVGAFLPIIPFFFMSGLQAIVAAAGIALAAHFTVGASRAMLTVRPWWKSGLEMTAFGAVEGITTFGIGVALGHFVGAN